mgnify:CR=1 FL=1
MTFYSLKFIYGNTDNIFNSNPFSLYFFHLLTIFLLTVIIYILPSLPSFLPTLYNVVVTEGEGLSFLFFHLVIIQKMNLDLYLKSS